MARTFYERLGVRSSADQDEIAAAYRERVKEYHPDVSDHPNATERFKGVSEAYEVLSDPVERRRYDRLGHASYRELTAPAGGRGATGPGSRGTGTSRRRSRTGRSRTRGTGRRSDSGFWAAIGVESLGDHIEESPIGSVAERLAAIDWGPAERVVRGLRLDHAAVTVGRGTVRTVGVSRAVGRSIGGAVRRWLGSYDRNPWLQVLRTFGSGRLMERRRAVLVGGAAMYVYPFLLSSLFPVFETIANGTGVGPFGEFLLGVLIVSSLLLSGIPNVGLLFFSSWGIVFPVIVWHSRAYGPTSPVLDGVIAACWLPFLHSVVVLELIRRRRGFI